MGQPGELPMLTDGDETGSLASDLAAAYGRMSRFYRDQLQMKGPEADRRARGLDMTAAEAAEDAARIRERPPHEVSWFDLNRLADRDPEALATAWRDLRAAAQKELASGHRAARALDWDGAPWDRVRYLAIRDACHADTRPQTGIETALTDLAAEAYSDFLEWSGHLHMQASTEAQMERHDLATHGEWKPARLATADAMEQSSRMAERAHLRLLRTVKALTDLRRAGPPVYVSHAGQVNVGQRQVNIAQLASNEGA